MVYENFQPSGEAPDSKLDTARIIQEVGAAGMSAAFKSNCDADKILGTVSFINTDGDPKVSGSTDGAAESNGGDPPSKPNDGTDRAPENKVDAAVARPDRAKIEELQEKYGIHVISIITPSRIEYGVYQHDKLQFSTEQADLEGELKKQGFHDLKEIGCDKNASLDDYQGYVKRNYGLHTIHIMNGLRSTYAVYNDKNQLVSDGSLADLQNAIEKNAIPRIKSGDTGKKVMTHLPNGETAIELPDGSEVLLTKDKQVSRFTTPSGDTRTPENAEGTQWRTGDGASLKGKFSFSADGVVTFDILDEKSELAKRAYTGKNGVEDTYKDGTKVSYVAGVAKQMVTNDGTVIAFEGRSNLSITQKNGGKLEVKVEDNGRLSARNQGESISDEQQLRLQTTLGNAYVKLGRLPEAIKHQQVVLDAAEQKYVPGSVEVVDQHKLLEELKRQNRDNKGADWHAKEIQEIKRVADYLQRVAAAPDDLARAFIVADSLPANLKLDTSGKTIRLDLTDAGKALEAIPGLRLPGTRDTSGLKALALDGNKFKIEGNGSFQFKIPNTETMTEIKLNNVTADISADPNDPSKVKLSNIRGFSISAYGAKLQPEHLTLSAVKNADGSESLKIEFGKLVPAISADGKPDALGQVFGVVGGSKIPDIPPVEINVPKEVHLEHLMKEVGNWAKAGDAKDAGKMFEAIVGLYANTEISNIFRDVTQMKKTGSKIEIDIAGRNDYKIGGLPLAWNAKVSAELVHEGGKVTLKNIEGARTKLPLPADVANGLGMKNPMEIAIKEISLSEPDKDGNRVATFKTDSVVESVSLKVGPNFEPVRDKLGNITVEANLKSGDARANVRLLANPDQLAKGDPKDIDFTVQVTGGSDKVAQIAQGFIGHELDPTVAELINGVESITKKGDQITITRKAESTHDKSGLKVHVAKTVGFKIDPTAPNLELKDITGVDIVDLPDVAGQIYGHKMPIRMRYLSLSGANQAGERVLTMRADGVVSSATLYLDAGMKPKEIVAVVENPAKYLKESLGNRDMIAQKLDRATKGKSYTIRIKGDGTVDLDGLGGVGGVSDMLLNGGDLVSVTGVASTAAGYLGTTVTRGSGEANRGLGNKIIETWNGLFK